MNENSGASRVFCVLLGDLACLVPFGPTSMRVFCYNRKVLLKISKNEVTDLRVVAGEFGGRPRSRVPFSI